MALKHPKPSINHVGEYQVSGRPFALTFTPLEQGSNGDGAGKDNLFGANEIVDDLAAAIDFPTVAKSLRIRNGTDNDIYVYFCSLLVPVNRAPGDDINEANAAIPGNPCSRGNRITLTELASYHNGANDNRPNSTVKVNKQYYTMATGEVLDIDVKCRRVYIAAAAAGNAADCTIIAELTGIEQGYDLDHRGIAGVSGGSAGTKFLNGQEI